MVLSLVKTSDSPNWFNVFCLGITLLEEDAEQGMCLNMALSRLHQQKCLRIRHDIPTEHEWDYRRKVSYCSKLQDRMLGLN